MGEEPSKDLLLDFLNELLKEEQGEIVELTYLKNKVLGHTGLEVPDKLRETIFLKLFEKAEIAKFNHDDYMQYEESLKYYRDLKNSLDTAREEACSWSVIIKPCSYCDKYGFFEAKNE